MNKGRSSYVAQAGMIAAVLRYPPYRTLLLLQGEREGLAWGIVKFRISSGVRVVVNPVDTSGGRAEDSTVGYHRGEPSCQP